MISTVPDEVDVRIVSDTDPSRSPVTGRAPNNFPVPRERYPHHGLEKELSASDPRVDFDIDLAETKPLFFKLDEIPARLQDRDQPAGLDTVRERQPGAERPYHQDVAPGHL